MKTIKELRDIAARSRVEHGERMAECAEAARRVARGIVDVLAKPPGDAMYPAFQRTEGEGWASCAFAWSVADGIDAETTVHVGKASDGTLLLRLDHGDPTPFEPEERISTHPALEFVARLAEEVSARIEARIHDRYPPVALAMATDEIPF